MEYTNEELKAQLQATQARVKELESCSQATIALRSQCDEYYAQIKRLEAALDKAAAETVAMEEMLTGQLKASEERCEKLEAYRLVEIGINGSLRMKLQIAEERITELEAQNQHLATMCREYAAIQSRLLIERDYQFTAPQNTPAGRMVDQLEDYENYRVFNLNSQARNNAGWFLKQLFMDAQGEVFAWWQRPVASGQGSEVGE